jgi:NADH:ubiquinone oxidoreductase subunit 3 (subunit A)
MTGEGLDHFPFVGVNMPHNWIYIGLFLLIVAIFPGAPILMAALLSPRKPNALKNETYECGIETYGETWVQFKAQYYIYALTFLVFDVELVFLFPWAVAFDQLTLFGVIAGVLFLFVLFIELLAAWRKGLLEWL